MNKHFLICSALCSLLSLSATANDENEIVLSDTEIQTTEETYVPGSDMPEAEGFITHYLNNALDKAVPATEPTEKMEYGRKVTKWATAPRFGGYVIGKYAYSSQEGKHSGDGFSVRLVRAYVDGTILKDFNYRLQVEMNGTFHVKDFFIEYAHWKEFKVKVGQFKRIFTYEDPYNPWDVGVGDYSQLVKKLSGFSDYIGGEASNNGGRDLGIQVQGDFLKVGEGKNERRLFHYQAGVFSGQGINQKDANSQKDLQGSFQVQPVKDLWIGVFGWTGNYTNSSKVTVHRYRWALGAKYEHNGWSARAEYAHHTGHKLSDYYLDTDDNLYKWKGTARADGWYATVGVPCTNWLKVYAKYDAYRNDATSWNDLRSIYSVCPNFQLHKNLMFQVQYNYVHDKSIATARSYHELWAETYFRF